jgi:hypothetical protein
MPPSIIEQIRQQQAWEQPKKRGSAGFIIGTIAAFAAGILLVMSFGAFPSLSPKALFASKTAVVAHNKPAEVSISSRGRLGDASESKLLRTCMPSSMGAANSMGGMDNKGLYNLLSATDQMMSIAVASGAQDTAAGAKAFSTMWAEVADCVFRQNGYVLCEPDNRALAVEAVTAFVKQSAFAATPQATTTLSPRSNQALEQKMHKVRATRERVLETLKTRVQEGRLISSDFGFFAPGEISRIMKDTKPTSDACATRS